MSISFIDLQETQEALLQPDSVPAVDIAAQRALVAQRKAESKAKAVPKAPKPDAEANTGDNPDGPIYAMKSHKRKLAEGKVSTAYAVTKVVNSKNKQLVQLLSTALETANEFIQGLVDQLNAGDITEEQALQRVSEVKSGKSVGAT